MEHELPNIPIWEEELIGDSSTATMVEDDATESLDVLLGRTVDVDSIVARVAAPNRTPIDFARLASIEDGESFDASENILDDIATPEIPPYVQSSPGTVDAPVFAKRHQASTKKFRAPGGINVGENTARKVVSENGRFVCEYDAEGGLLRGYEMVEVED